MYLLGIITSLLIFLLHNSQCLDNGVALTPPMGWISSERFACNVDCVKYPDDCISEHLVKSIADAMATKGFLDNGYRYVILGDCWQNKTGDPSPDPKRFPGGLQALADYVHGKGLLFGLQIELGNESSNGFPGCYGNCEKMAKRAAEWGVDYVRATGYGIKDGHDLKDAYGNMERFLNKTKRRIVYDCNIAVELKKKGMLTDYGSISEMCNMYTTNNPMVDSWESLEKAIKFFENVGRDVVNYTGPGRWHTGNMLMVGNYGLSEHEQTMQMAVWSVMTSPLLVSADVRYLRPEQQSILLNKATLSIDQDELLLMGTEIMIKGQVHIWRKAIQPPGSYALLFMYFNISGGPSRVSILISDLGLRGHEQFKLTNVMTGQVVGVYKPWFTFDSEVDPVGSLLIRAEPLPPSIGIKR